MNTKRKAELQRKLSLASVPKPPAGLADRIKSDIPKYLQPEADRERLRRSVAFNMRVAASILLVVTSVVTAFYLLDPEERMMTSMAPAAQAPQSAARSNVERKSVGTYFDTATQPTDEVQVEITQAAPKAQTRLADARAQVLSTRDDENKDSEDKNELAAKKAENAVREESFAPDVDASVVGGVVADVVNAPAESPQVAEVDFFTAEPAPAMPVPAPATPAPAKSEARQRALGRRAAAPPPVPVLPPPMAEAEAPSPSLSVTKEAYASKLDLGPKSAVFGISVDPDVFGRIKSTIESGQRPRASSVNVEALVNYFAGPPARPVRSGVRLEVEASPAVVAVEGGHSILRFTVDTVTAEIAEGASVPPIAKDVHLEIEFNEKAIVRATPIGDRGAMAPESTLLQNTSVTGLYAVDLRSNLKADERIATVRLHYTALPSGKKQTIEDSVYRRDMPRKWTRATRRHRLASLGALWGQSLIAMSGGAEVARRAEELANQDPADERARELARAATKTGNGR